MKSIIWVIIILVHCNTCYCNNAKIGTKYEIINVITDFFLVLNQPIRITTSELCWAKGDFYRLTKALNNKGFLTTPSKGNLSTYWPHEQQMFVIDMACKNSNETLILASNSNLMEYPFRWLIIQEANDTELVPNLNIYIRSKIYILQRNSDGYKIISKYRLGLHSKEYHSNEVALWRQNAFIYYNRLIDSNNRTNVMKETINMSYVIMNPKTADHLLDGRNKHIQSVTKVNYPLTLHVLEVINATPNYLVTNTWGYKRPNESNFGGLTGFAQRKLIDISATGMIVMRDRLPYIDLIASTTPSIMRFIFRAPPLSYVKSIYVLPFQVNVWLACFGIICISSIIFFVITYWETYDDAFNDNDEDSHNITRLRPNVSDILQLQIGTACQQGSEAEPVSVAGRIATIFLLVSMLFLYTSYSANIVGLLQSTTDSIRTVEDLLYSRITLGALEHPYTRPSFLAQTRKTHKAIYIEKVAPPGKPENIMDIYAGVKRMRDEYFAFVADRSSAYKVVGDIFREHEKCGLMEIDYFNVYEPFFAIRKNTSYGELFKVALRKMGERGIVNCRIKRIYSKKPPCLNQGGNYLIVSLTDCYAAFLIFGTGVGIATLILIVEKIFYYRETRTRWN